MKQTEIEGIIDINSSGSGYLLQEEDDIYIYKKNIGQALNGDLIKIETIPSKQPGKIEGRVTQILKRHKKEFVGILAITDKGEGKRKYGFVIPDSKKMHRDIFIPDKELKGLSHGEKVLCEITNWYSDAKNPNGRIVKSLGFPGENDTEMNSIIYEYGFDIEFPENVEKESENIEFEISQDEIDKRRDFRDILTIAIDPIGCKDRDDSLSYRKLPNGNIEVGIHIADVTFYCKKGSKLDEEALNRGTSVYLVDRTIPMLPERLSNQVCSLDEGTDKLSYSFLFEFNNNKIVNQWFGRGVVNLDKAMSYEDAQEMIDNNDKSEVGKSVIKLNDLAKNLRKKRDIIEFSRTEYRFILDENNKSPLGIEIKKSMETNKLIEEFMLLTNRRVGEFIFKKKKPSLYRSHESPNEEKLLELSNFISNFGFRLDISNIDKIKKSLDKLMKDIDGHSMETLISTLAVRTMSKAYCTPDEEHSHYGLGMEHYSWVTSPIRRYADICVHRVLSDVLGNDGYPNK